MRFTVAAAVVCSFFLVLGCGTDASNGGPTQTTLAISSPVLISGGSVTLTATVTPADAHGTVGFTDANSTATGAVTLSNGKAVLTVMTTGPSSQGIAVVAPGTHHWIAGFSAEEPYQSSGSSGSQPVVLTVQSPGANCGLVAATVVPGSTVPGNGVIVSTVPNGSAVCAAGSGATVSLSNPTITSSGTVSEYLDESGMGAAVLAYGDSEAVGAAGGRIVITGGTVAGATTGAGAVFASGVGSSVTLSGTTVTTPSGAGSGPSGDFTTGYTVGAARGGSVSLANAAVTSSQYAGFHAGPVLMTFGDGSSITASGGAVTGYGDIADLEGAGSVALTDETVTAKGAYGVRMFASSPDETKAGDTSFSMTRGTFTWSGSSNTEAVYVGSPSAKVTFTGTTMALTYQPGANPVFLAVGGELGPGSTGAGSAQVTLNGVTLNGDMADGAPAAISLALVNGTVWSGAFEELVGLQGTNTLTMDAGSTWNVLTDCALTVLNDSAGISGTSVSNIVGNGHTVTYVPAQNPSLGGKTYTLAGGGTLKPAN